MAEDKNSESRNPTEPSKTSEKGGKSQQEKKPSNEITERERVHDKTYVRQIEEKTERH